jgi:hypothetical protein
MAQRIMMKHKDTGVVKTGFYGFSWTTLFFGFFPALFRGDYITFIGGFVIYLILAIATFGILPLIISIIWAFIYNKYFTTKLLERGYVFNDSEGNVLAARAKLGIV